MNYLKFVVDDIHTVVAATVDSNGLPVTCAIDIMDYDEKGLFFSYCKRKRLLSKAQRQRIYCHYGN